MKCYGLMLVVILLGGLLPVRGGDLVLVERGKRNVCAVVIPTKAEPVQKNAAQEFVKYVEQVAGVRLAIVSDDQPLPEKAVFIGETRQSRELLGENFNFASLGEEGFRVVVLGNRLLIAGNCPRGVLYGVYDVLERFGGVGFFAPWRIVAKPRDRLAIPESTDYVEKPCFAMRQPTWFVFNDPDFASMLRVNDELRSFEPRHGGRAVWFGGGLWNSHTFLKLVDPELYFDAHPEYFSEVDGKRERRKPQLCLTNPDVRRIVTSNVLSRIGRANPRAKYFGVSQMDWENPCTCTNCMLAYSHYGQAHSGALVDFINSVADAVTEKYPGKIVQTLAYHYNRRPPRKNAVRMRDNTTVCLCSIECDIRYPVPDSADTACREFTDDIRRWCALTDRLSIWDYTTCFTHFAWPYPNLRSLQGNLRFYRDNHVQEIISQGAARGRGSDMGELKAYLIAKWMWNPELDGEKLIAEFLEGYYGAAAPLVKEYLNALYAEPYDMKSHRMGLFDEPETQTFLSREFTDRARAIWQKAEAAVADDPALLDNVRMSEFSIVYAQYELTKLDKKDPQRDRTLRELATWLTARLNEHRDIRLSDHQHHNDRKEMEIRNRVEANELPLADVSTDVSNQVVVAEGTKNTYQGHPTMAQLEDGRLIAVWTDGHGGACGPAAESTDGGRSWTRIDGRFPADWKNAVNCPSIYELVGPDGRKRLWIWAQVKLPAGVDKYDHGLRYRHAEGAMPSVVSEDGGRTWRVMPPLGKKFQCVMAFSSIVKLKDGSYLGAFHVGPDGKDEHPLGVWTSVTKDGGFTWSEPKRVLFDRHNSFCEPCLVRSPDGKTLAMLCRENHRQLGRSAIAFSTDEGKTWTEYRPSTWGLTGDRHTAIRLKDGRYFVAMRDTAVGSKTWGQYVAWIGTWEDLIGNGKGARRIRLLNHRGNDKNGSCSWDTGYSGVAQLPDGTVVCVTYMKYRDDDSKSSVVSTRLCVP